MASHAPPADHVELLADTHELIDSILADIDRATRRVWIEVYIVRSDRLGRQLRDALLRAVARGVDVRLVTDALGSQETPRAYFTALRGGGAGVRIYRNFIRSLRTGRIFPRDHGRIVVIDDAAYTGGFAFGDEWLRVEDGGKGWHDIGARVRGPLVEDFARIFVNRWEEARDVARRPAEGETSHCHGNLELVADVPSIQHAVLERHLEWIDRARRRVWIENAYFFPPMPLLIGLANAAARGVDVRILTPARSDVRTVQWAARGEYERWIALGIQVFEYGRRMMHGKAIVVDDDWASLGSFNVNLVTLRFASEVSLFVRDPAFVAELAAKLEDDFAISTPIDAAWVRRQHPIRRLWWWLARLSCRVYERLSPLRLELPERRVRREFAARTRDARSGLRLRERSDARAR